MKINTYIYIQLYNFLFIYIITHNTYHCHHYLSFNLFNLNFTFFFKVNINCNKFLLLSGRNLYLSLVE
ncbi:hypothetical protein LbFV_ORF95 [Leptopilina boulardi filamentous virus]|uniref:Uncharacterized protein n=1 Tax=Leptopilina boulardi filamentous virus TaxID=552509 RepID=A0A1S5YDF0_9VIRU|nr:hypothetical protein LbFV_ORF95 [Leptopilina boulardi filamentous virus]AQQ80015.1 hypothetical protein LbFV_ORF95 [Leptopilina boulardi filamentous virus]